MSSTQLLLRFRVVCLLGLLAVSSSTARADDPAVKPVAEQAATSSPAADETTAPPPPADALPAAAEVSALSRLTAWSDEFVQHDWRIQRNVLTGEHRLLDDRDFVRAVGDFAQCRDRFGSQADERSLAPVSGKVVILLHGLFRSHHAGIPLQRKLAESGYSPLRVGYASTQADIDSHAASLKRVVSYLTDATEIYFVAHSMGNIVIRKYLSDALQEHGQIDPRIKRLVMLGPPNHGSAIALSAGSYSFLNRIAGEGVLQLGGQWEQFVESLKLPPLEFGIIAGCTAVDSLGNPLLPGRDDLVVRVDETKLAGACDFVVLPVIHMRMFADRAVQQHTLRFLEHGYFVSADQRNRLEAPAAATDSAAEESE